MTISYKGQNILDLPRFKGQWVDDRASGFGVFAYADGQEGDNWLNVPY